MLPVRSVHRKTYLKGARIAVVATALAVALGVILALSVNVFEKQKRLQTANSDSVIWTLSQLEVEFLRYSGALQEALLQPEDAATLANLRQKFDIFFSRVTTVENATSLRTNVGTESVDAYFKDIRAVLTAAIPLIDANDTVLAASLPDLMDGSRTLSPIVREVSLKNLQNFTQISTAARYNVLHTMQVLGVLTFAMIIVLVALSFALFRLAAVNERNANKQRSLAARVQTILDTALDAVLVVDRDGNVQEFNGAATAIFGYQPEEAIGANLRDLIIPEEYRRGHDIGMERMRRTGETRLIGGGRIEIEALRKDGTTFPVELSIETAHTPQGDVYVSFIRDISARKAAEAEIVEARDRALAGERTKSRFLAVMSHEMRTPLNGLLGMLDLIRHTRMDEKQSFYVQNMEYSGRVLMDLINNVLDLTKLETEVEALNISSFDPQRLVQEVLASQMGLARKNENDLSFDWVGNPVPGIKTDRARLRQVLLNLVNNAIKFTKNGEVIVEAEIHEPVTPAGQPELELRVIDSGCGIAAEDQKRIFDDFETIDDTYDRNVEGSGLGLGIVRRLVQMIRGSIGVTSEPGEGSMFWVRIPIRIEAAEDSFEAPVVLPQKGKALNLLMVEDNMINRRVLREMLESAGHTVSEAHDGMQGVEAANATAFDAILMDISMPGMDGVAATRAIRSGTGPNKMTPIIAATAHALPEEIETFTEAGMNDVLSKPIIRAELNKILHYWTADEDDDDADIDFSEGEEEDGDNSFLAALARDLPPEEMRALVERFVTETDRAFDALVPLAQSEENRKEVTSIVHKTAGSAGSFGLDELHAALAEAQTQLKTNPDYNMPEGVAELSQAWLGARVEITMMMLGYGINLELEPWPLSA